MPEYEEDHSTARSFIFGRIETGGEGPRGYQAKGQESGGQDVKYLI